MACRSESRGEGWILSLTLEELIRTTIYDLVSMNCGDERGSKTGLLRSWEVVEVQVFLLSSMLELAIRTSTTVAVTRGCKIFAN